LIIAYNIDFKFPERKKEEIVFPDVPDNIELESEIRSEPVEFTVNDKLGRAKKQEQNIVVTPSRFEEKVEDEIVIPTFTPAVNVMNAPIILSPTIDTPIAKPDPVLTIEKSPELTIEKTEEDKKSEELVEQFGAYDPTLDLASYKYPHLDLLENYGSNKISVDADELEANKNKIVETLNHYNIEIDKIKATIGPTVTLYEIIPAPGVRISKIKNLEDDIALSLAALGIRIIAPMPGKGTIGIEVPNLHPEMVSMRSILATEKFQTTTMDLPIALGKTISNEVYIADLAKMPHLLVAGATGQGKSVGINAILVSLLYKKHPAQLKFVLVDPKKVELTLFNKIERHFLAKLPGEAD
ncbi:MAG: DNA translocase FtsK, partial [Pedobacter sp.]